MISISTITGNSEGNVILKSNQDFRNNTARISRTKTLDGGVYINHSGLSEGDRTLKLKCKLTKAVSEILWSIFQTETFIHCAIQSGLYYAAIDKLDVQYGHINMTVLINNKEN